MTFHLFQERAFDWPAWITAISTALLVLGVIAALWALRDARKTRDGQLVADLSRRWDEPLIHESLVLYSIHGPSGIIDLIKTLYEVEGAEPLSKEKLELYHKLSGWPTLVDTIGVLVSEKAISAKVVYKMWGAQIVAAWESWRDPVHVLRDIEETDEAFAYFESLAGKMEKQSAQAAKRRRSKGPSGQASDRPEAQAEAEAPEPPDEPKV